MVEQARLEQSDAGLVAAADGWFVVNVREAARVTSRVIFMTGSRRDDLAIVYPRNELALRHGAGVEQETTVPAEAYAPYPKWQPGRPESWAGLPWQ